LHSIATPKEAATVIIMRPEAGAGDGPFEVLMVHRHPDSAFVPECYVFPGGCIDEEDCAPELLPYCRGRDRETALRILGDMPNAELACGAWVAAVRETFEETGILLAHTPVPQDRRAFLRRRLLAGEKNFNELVREERLVLACDRLEYFAHWITPEFLPLRYDVRFFVTRAPEDQSACPDGVELTGHVWITPRRALTEYAADRFPMVLPTIMTLRELAAYRSIEAVLAAAPGKKVPAILTKVDTRNDRLVEIMPDGTVFSPVR
jgi:8-oxo-dGTP pyrophosphatase MutT (NUDIX family)